jgi:hypothetical protein
MLTEGSIFEDTGARQGEVRWVLGETTRIKEGPQRRAEGQDSAMRLAGVVGFCAESDPKQQEQIGRRPGRMSATAQIAQAKEPFAGERQTDQQPLHQQTIGAMVGDVFQTITVLAVIEAVVFDAPASLTEAKQAFGAELSGGNIGQPVALAEPPIRVMHPITQHPNRLPAQIVPGIKIICVPEFHPVC